MLAAALIKPSEAMQMLENIGVAHRPKADVRKRKRS
jgi:hypothetical protein